jgi:hypothetical protein
MIAAVILALAGLAVVEAVHHHTNYPPHWSTR